MKIKTIILAALLIGSIITLVTPIQFQIDTSSISQFDHYWERCVGSGHATLALRQDYREQLLRAHKEAGFQMVRFHGLLSDDMSVVLQGPGSTFYYSFFNIDQLFDYLLEIGMRPLVELSFMPELLASGESPIFHYKGNATPPKSQKQWYDLIHALVTHLVQRYGAHEVRQWAFEVWNEPNGDYFWTGGQQKYFELYNTTASAIKAVDTGLKVGGPATMQSGWLADFVAFCKNNKVPVDFVSTHEYPTDITPLQRDIMKKVFTKARETVGGLPLYYTEYNAGLGDQRYQDSSYAAAFVTKTIADAHGIVDILSFWTFTDIFEEGGLISKPYNGQYGMLTVYGTAKPVYRAFELLHKAGDKRFATAYLNGANQTTVDVLATADLPNRQIMIFISNYDVFTNKPASYNIQVGITESSIRIKPTTATIQVIDETHANSFTAWKQMGAPEYPTRDQLAKLATASELRPEKIAVNYDTKNQPYFDVSVSEYSLTVITVSF